MIRRILIWCGILLLLAAGITLVILDPWGASDGNATSSPSPVQSTASPAPEKCNPRPTKTPPMKPAAKSGPTKDQVFDFLSAAVMVNPDRRNAALVPYATCEYITSSLDGGDDDADTPSTLDVRVSDVVVGQPKIEGSSATLTATFTVEAWQDGKQVDPPETQSYTMTWVWTQWGWLMHTSPE